MIDKVKCEYPGCKEESCFRNTLDLVNEEGALVELPFCKYHSFIIMGGSFKAEMIKEQKNLLGIKEDTTFKLIGPMEEVGIIEQVMAARELIAKERVKI